MGNIDWENIAIFERFPKLNDELQEVGSKAKVKFMDDGTLVDSAKISEAMKMKGIKGIKPRDSYVFVVESNGNKKEFWLSATAYTNLAELKALREKKGTLIGVEALIERVSSKDPSQPAFRIQ